MIVVPSSAEVTVTGPDAAVVGGGSFAGRPCAPGR